MPFRKTPSSHRKAPSPLPKMSKAMRAITSRLPITRTEMATITPSGCSADHFWTAFLSKTPTRSTNGWALKLSNGGIVQLTPHSSAHLTSKSKSDTPTHLPLSNEPFRKTKFAKTSTGAPCQSWKRPACAPRLANCIESSPRALTTNWACPLNPNRRMLSINHRV